MIGCHHVLLDLAIGQPVGGIAVNRHHDILAAQDLLLQIHRHDDHREQLAPAKISLRLLKTVVGFNSDFGGGVQLTDQLATGGAVVLIDDAHRQIPYRAVGIDHAHDAQRQDQHQPHRPLQHAEQHPDEGLPIKFHPAPPSFNSRANSRLRTSSAVTSG
ncbi:hypothetical protein D3C72_1586550 [compost metagenome]